MRKKHCCYGLCSNDTRYSQRVSMKGVFFIPFPKPISNWEKCLKWIAACGRENFGTKNISSSTYMCSKHFVGGNGPTEENPDPIIFDPSTMIDNIWRYDRRRKAISGSLPNELCESSVPYLNRIYSYFGPNFSNTENQRTEIFGEEVGLVLEERDRRSILGPADNLSSLVLANIKLEPAEAEYLTDTERNVSPTRGSESNPISSVQIISRKEVTQSNKAHQIKAYSFDKVASHSSDSSPGVSSASEDMIVDFKTELLEGPAFEDQLLFSCADNGKSKTLEKPSKSCIENLEEQYDHKVSISLTGYNKESGIRNNSDTSSESMNIDESRAIGQDQLVSQTITTEFVPLHGPVAFADDLDVTPNPIYVFNSSNSNVKSQTIIASNIKQGAEMQFGSLTDLNTKFNIPKGWSVMSNDDMIILTIINFSTTGALKSLSISKDLNTTVKILNRNIDVLSVSNTFPRKIDSDAALQHALKEMESWHVCTGNAENRFLEAVRREYQHKGFYSWITNAAHSNKCALVIDTDQDRCQRCSHFRVCIRSVTSRQKSFKSSSSELLLERIRQSASEKKLLSEKLLRLQKRLEISIEKDEENLSMQDDSCSTD